VGFPDSFAVHTLCGVFDFSPYDAVLLDLDGTIYHEEHPLPGAVELVHRLQREGRKYACISNSTTSPERLVQRLGRMGIEMTPAHIYTAAVAAADHVVEHYGPRPRVFNLSTDGVAEMLEGKVEWVESGKQGCDAVIAGAVTNTYATEERQRMALSLLRAGATLIGICADRVYPSPRGIEFGSGAFCAMLAYAAATTPIFCGKPQAIFFRNLCHRMGVSPERCILIGDNLESDIAGGKAVGMQTVLVHTGVTTPGAEEGVADEMLPDVVAGDLRELA
jgi:4-nitrophenyl phosphatase